MRKMQEVMSFQNGRNVNEKKRKLKTSGSKQFGFAVVVESEDNEENNAR